MGPMYIETPNMFVYINVCVCVCLCVYVWVYLYTGCLKIDAVHSYDNGLLLRQAKWLVFGTRPVNNAFFELLGLLNKFPDFFRIGTFIDSTHMKL